MKRERLDEKLTAGEYQAKAGAAEPQSSALDFHDNKSQKDFLLAFPDKNIIFKLHTARSMRCPVTVNSSVGGLMQK